MRDKNNNTNVVVYDNDDSSSMSEMEEIEETPDEKNYIKNKQSMAVPTIKNS